MKNKNIPLLIVQVAMFVGYILNIVKFCECDFKPSYKAEIIHGIGMVTGAGVVIGYLNLGK